MRLLPKRRSDASPSHSAARAQTGTDRLPPISDRTAYLATCSRELEAAREAEECMAVIMVDLDHLSHINQQRGFEAGNAAILAMTLALRRNLRCGVTRGSHQIDQVYRTDGGGFFAILPGADYTGARTAVLRVQEALDQLAGFPLQVRIGMAAYPDDGEDLEQVLLAAGSRLFNAQAGHGRDAVPPVAPPSPRRRHSRVPNPAQGSLDLDHN